LLIYLTAVFYNCNSSLLYFSNQPTPEKWYVGRIVFFLNFSFLSENDGSTYALVEPMAVNGVASFDSTIPRVKAYPPEARKYAFVDVGELDGSVGLLTDIDCPKREKEARKKVEAGNEKRFKYVIRAGRAFPKTLESMCGKASDFYTTTKRYSDLQ
jgi:hypothetical protein